MRYVKLTIVIPEGNDFHEVHYHLGQTLGFFQDGMNSMMRVQDKATVTWEPVDEDGNPELT